MSKITFRADDDLVRQLEEFDASKSEVMREALREYLAGAEEADDGGGERTVDDALVDRVDHLIAERLDAHLGERGRDRSTHERRQDAGDVTVNISLDGVTSDEVTPAVERDAAAERKTDDDSRPAETTCSQCGDTVYDDHVYCPNCGEKTSHRVFCECGDELRSDWAFCPSCGRRTPAADVLDRT